MIIRSELEFSMYMDLQGYQLTGPVTSDMSIRDIQAKYLLESSFKKFKDEENEDAAQKAESLFLEMNDRCSRFKFDPRSIQHEQVIGEVKNLWWAMFDPLSFDSIPVSEEICWLQGRCGPGASLDVGSSNFYTKLFDSSLSSSDDRLYRLHEKFCDLHSSTWVEANEARHSRYDVGGRNTKVSVLGTVAKNVNIRRTTCTAPPLNMFFQLGLGNVLESALKRFYNIDLSTQESINKQLAREGSLNQKLGTIDLRSASDTIALKLVDELTPKKLNQLLHSFRSPQIQVGEQLVQKWMLSTMGNGFTFPFQTLLFATVVDACYKVLGISLKTHGARNFGVYGDDIIVQHDAYSFVSDCLAMFGFIVNTDKSFNHGNFRESCGGDYYSGVNVRGYYIKSLKRRSDVNAVYSGLTVWQSRTGISLKHTMNYLIANTRCVNWIPLYEDPSSGFYATDVSVIGPSYKKLVPIPNTHPVIAIPYKRGYGNHKIIDGKKEFTCKINPMGQLIAVLGGYVRDGAITLRSKSVDVQRFRYVTVSLYPQKRDFIGATPFINYMSEIDVNWRELIFRASRDLSRVGPINKFRGTLVPEGQRCEALRYDDIYRIKRVHQDMQLDTLGCLVG